MMKKSGEKTGFTGIVLMVFCAVCLCMGQFVWKYYAGILPVVIGFGIYGVGALSMLCAYRFGSLSVLQPINSVSYVIAAILGNAFFDEAVTARKFIGIGLIMLGVICLARDEVSE